MDVNVLGARTFVKEWTSSTGAPARPIAEEAEAVGDHLAEFFSSPSPT